MKQWGLKPEDAEDRERLETCRPVTRTGLRRYRCERCEIIIYHNDN